MSFFRSPVYQSNGESTSTDFSSSDDLSIDRVRTLSHASDANGTFTPASAPAGFHKDMLLHASIELNCRYEAVDELRKAGIAVESKDDPRVESLAREKYNRVTEALASNGILPDRRESEQFKNLRRQYGEGLTQAAAGLQISQAANQVHSALQRNGSNANLDTIEKQLKRTFLSTPNFNDQRLLSIGLPIGPLPTASRYIHDFEELGVLGKGGYGVVFLVKHRLDGQQYAVKKIPLGASRMRKIEQNGQEEINSILREATALARLKHPNIVRYHVSWIEPAVLTLQKRLSSPAAPKLLRGPPSRTEDQSSDRSAGIQFHFDLDEDLDADGHAREISEVAGAENVLFEDSTRRTEDDDIVPSSLTAGTPLLGTPSLGTPLDKIQSRSTVASVSDEEVEEVIPRRDMSTSVSFTTSQSQSGGPSRAAHPCLALHIQMSLYPMDLTTFLSPTTNAPDPRALSSLRHCFHAPAALRLFLSIVDGVRYLHRRGIVHRDLKPGNIFLDVDDSTDCPPGAIPLSDCKRCVDAGGQRPGHVMLCIADFGLVTTIACPEEPVPATSAKVVGTELYRPDSVKRDNHPSLDVFAMGIIAFELVWRFGTRMERYETLRNLKRGQFPPRFGETVECAGMEDLIKSMVCASEDECPTWEELRARAVHIMAHC